MRHPWPCRTPPPSNPENKKRKRREEKIGNTRTHRRRHNRSWGGDTIRIYIHRYMRLVGLCKYGHADEHHASPFLVPFGNTKKSSKTIQYNTRNERKELTPPPLLPLFRVARYLHTTFYRKTSTRLPMPHGFIQIPERTLGANCVYLLIGSIRH